MPYKNGNIPPNSIIWTEDMLQYLVDNYKTKTNDQLATHLGLKKTSCRMKIYEMGLQRMKLEYWPDAAISFLKDNYRIMGDVEIAELFNKKFPKQKSWTKKHIAKKRGYLGLQRTKAEYSALMKKNLSKEGRSYTIDRNSPSKNMHPGWVASLIAWRNPELRKEILKHPELIEQKKAMIKLNRKLKKMKIQITH